MDEVGAQGAQGGQVGGDDGPSSGEVFEGFEGEAGLVERAGGVGHQADVHEPQVARQRGAVLLAGPVHVGPVVQGGEALLVAAGVVGADQEQGPAAVGDGFQQGQVGAGVEPADEPGHRRGRRTPGGSGALGGQVGGASVPQGMSSGSRPRPRHMAATAGLAAMSRPAVAATCRSRRASMAAFTPNNAAPATKSSLAQ